MRPHFWNVGLNRKHMEAETVQALANFPYAAEG
jgi:hypothetical protein